jgi:hypothetical protein
MRDDSLTKGFCKKVVSQDAKCREAEECKVNRAHSNSMLLPSSSHYTASLLLVAPDTSPDEQDIERPAWYYKWSELSCVTLHE